MASVGFTPGAKTDVKPSRWFRYGATDRGPSDLGGQWTVGHVVTYTFVKVGNPRHTLAWVDDLPTIHIAARVNPRPVLTYGRRRRLAALPWLSYGIRIIS